MTPTPPFAHLALADLEAMPGEIVQTSIRLTNDQDRPATFALSVAGVEPEWIRLAATVGPVGPGATLEVPLELRLPVGYPPATLAATVTARGLGGDQAGRTASADLRIVVGDGSLILAQLDPPEVRGSQSARVDVVLRNRGQDPLAVELHGISPDDEVRIRFSRRTTVLHPGAEVRVRSRVRAPRPTTGATRRRPFGVRVQGRSTPVVLEGTFVQRPVLAPWLFKAVAIVAVVAVWVAVAIVGISAISRHVRHSAEAHAIASSPPVTAPGGPSAGGGSGSGSGSGTSGSGSAGGGRPGFGKPGAAGTDAVSGKVTGLAAPGGVAVSIQPITLAANATEDATVVDAVRGTGGLVWGNQAAGSADPDLAAAVTNTATQSRTTTGDGSWAFAGLETPDTYLVTFTKRGYNTAKYVVTTTAAGQTINLTANLSTASGQISGTISGRSGPLGGAGITVSSGPISVTTTTPTTGPGVGDWSIGGLSTPGTYLVTATLPNYGTQTTTVTLGPSDDAHGVNLDLTPGVGTITGVVLAADGNGGTGSGVGGLSVTVANASTELSTTTLTDGEVGAYTLPNLPIPGTYDLTVSGAGYQTETEKIDLTGNLVRNITVVSADANVAGRVQTYFPANVATACPNQADQVTSPVALGGAGVTLTNGTSTYKTLSGTGSGYFEFDGIPIGDYVLTATSYCYATATRYITVAPGGRMSYDLDLGFATSPDQSNATITGFVVNEFDGQPLANVPVALDGGTQTAKTNDQGAYLFSDDVSPGAHSVTTTDTGCGITGPVTCGNEPGQPTTDYESSSATVNVGLSGYVTAPTIELPQLDTLTGQIVSAANNNPIAGATVTLVPETGNESAQATATTAADGTYKFTALIHGSYELMITAAGYVPDVSPCPSSEQSCAPPVPVNLTLGQDLAESPIRLTQGPTFNTVVDDTSGSPVDNACVVVVPQTSGDQFQTEAELTGTTGMASFPEAAAVSYPPDPTTTLTQGDNYTAYFFAVAGSPSVAQCTVAEMDSNAVLLSPPHNFVAENDNVSTYTAVLSPIPEGVNVSVDFSYAVPAAAGAAGDSYACPLVATPPSPADVTGNAASYCPGVSLSSTGGSFSLTIEGTDGSGNQASATLTEQGSTNVWSVPSSKLASLNLSSNNVSLVINGGSGFASLTIPVTLVDVSSSGGGTQMVTADLVPAPSQVIGTVTGGNGSALKVTVDPSTVTVPSAGAGSTRPGGTTANVSVSGTASTCPNGDATALLWTDSSEPAACTAQPGYYKLTGSAAGLYTATPSIVQVGACATGADMLCPGSNTQATLALSAEGVLTVKLSGSGSLPSSGLGAMVYLAYSSSSGSGPVTLVSSANGGQITAQEETTSGADIGSATTDGYAPIDGTGSQVVFSYLDPTNTGYYTVVVAAPGYQTWFSAPFQVTTAGAKPMVDAAPVPQSGLTGTVDGTLLGSTAAISGATVTATFSSGTCTDPAAFPTGSGFTDTAPAPGPATTDSNGAFAFTGNSTVTVSSSGALSGNVNGGLCASDQYSLTASAADYQSETKTATVGASTTFDLAASSVSQEIDVEVSGGGDFPADAVVNLSYSPSGGGSGDSGACTTAVTGSQPNGSGTTTCTYTTVAGSAANTFSEVKFTLTGLAPTTYTFTIGATDAQSETISGISEAGSSHPAPLLEYLVFDQFKISGTLTGTTSAGIPNIGLTLEGNGEQINTTTDANGGYTFTGVATGNYTISLTDGPGYTLTSGGSPPSVTTGTSYSISEPLTLAATSPDVTVTTTSSVASATSDLSGADVTLTRATSTQSLPASCASQSGSDALLAAGQGGASYSGTVSGSSSAGYSVDLGSVIPDFYTLTVSNTAAGMPPQTATAPMPICPGSTDSLSYVVQQAELDGTITEGLPAGVSPSTPTVSVGSTTLTSVTESGTASASSATYTWTDLVAPGGTDDVAVSLAGYTNGDATANASVTPSSTMVTDVTSTLTANNVSVVITADDAGGNALPNATVSITKGPSGVTLPTGSMTADANGQVTFSLPPDEDSSHQYQATVTYGANGVSATQSFNVSVGQTSNFPTVTVPVGMVNLTVTTAGTPPSNVDVSFACTSGCGSVTTDTPTPLTAGTNPAQFTYSGEVPTVDTSLTVSAAGYMTDTQTITIPGSTSVALVANPPPTTTTTTTPTTTTTVAPTTTTTKPTTTTTASPPTT